MGVRGYLRREARTAGNKGGPDAWDPPSAHPASPRPPSRAPTPAGRQSSCGCSQLPGSPHLAGRALTSCRPGCLEGGKNNPPPPPAGGRRRRILPAWRRARPSRSRREEPPRGRLPSFPLPRCPGRRGARGGGWHRSQAAGEDRGFCCLRATRNRGILSVRAPSPTPWTRGCASFNLLVDCNQQASLPGQGHSLYRGVTKKLSGPQFTHL